VTDVALLERTLGDLVETWGDGCARPANTRALPKTQVAPGRISPPSRVRRVDAPRCDDFCLRAAAQELLPRKN